jgi:hypothetical protein
MIKANFIIESISDLIILNERNIINQDDIDNYLNDLSKEAEYPETKEWIQKKLRVYLLNSYPEVSEWKPDDVDHYSIPKWVPDAVKRGDKIYRIELYPQPALSEIQQIVHCMNQLHDFSLRDYSKMVKTPMGKDLVSTSRELWNHMLKKGGFKEIGIDYSGGYRWVTLQTEETIRYEGEELGNCLKRFSNNYYKDIKAGRSILYSLRDSNNKPKADIEVDVSKNEVAQIKGHNNGPVDQQYWKFCYDLIERGRYGHVDDTENIGAIWDDNRLVPEKEITPDQAKKTWKTLFMRLYDGKGVAGASIHKIRQLLDYGANIDAPINHLNATALMIAAYDGESQSVIGELVTRGANLEARDKNDSTPMMYAALGGDIDSAEILFEAGADINAKARNGDTALILAVARGHYNMIRWLFDTDVLEYADDIEEIGKLDDVSSHIWDVLARYGAVSY